MDYATMQTRTLSDRFGETKRTDAKAWINTGISNLWALYAWAFKREPPTAFTWTASTPDAVITNLTTAGVEEILHVYDADGVELRPLTNEEFEATYQGADPGTPKSYTTYGAGSTLKLRLGPTPAASGSGTASFNRSAPTLVDDTDDLADEGWPAEHHLVAVFEAQMIGMQNESDPSYAEIARSHGRALDAMLAALLPDSGGTNREYGRDEGV